MDNLLVEFLKTRSTGIITQKCVNEFVEFLVARGETLAADEILLKYSNIFSPEGLSVAGLERLIDAKMSLEKAFEHLKSKSKVKTMHSFHLHDNHSEYSSISDAVYYADPAFFASKVYFTEYTWKKYEGYLVLENNTCIVEIAGWVEEPNKKNPMWKLLKGIIPKELYQNF